MEIQLLQLISWHGSNLVDAKMDQMAESGHDLNGQQFASWTVIKKAKSRNDISYWLCECAELKRMLILRVY